MSNTLPTTKTEVVIRINSLSCDSCRLSDACLNREVRGCASVEIDSTGRRSTSGVAPFSLVSSVRRNVSR